MNRYAESTLQHMTKKDLINIIKCMSEDINNLTEINHYQVHLLNSILGDHFIVKNGQLIIDLDELACEQRAQGASA